MNKKNSQRGFTLIEMLVVIGIIGLLASVVLVGLTNARKGGRDARRIADLKSIQTGLEAYYNKCGFYPGLADCATTGDPAIPFGTGGLNEILEGTDVGLPNVPDDPDPAKHYEYGVSDGVDPNPPERQSYVLSAELETGNKVLDTDVDGDVYGVDCGDATADTIYCIQQ